jgi:hypothetical protein
VGLWLRSYQRGAAVGSCRGAWSLASENGRLSLSYLPYSFFDPKGFWSYKLPTEQRRHAFDCVGFSFTRLADFSSSPGGYSVGWSVGVPYWFLALASGIGSIYLFAAPRRRQSKRRNLGLCMTCGYDLRATPEGCPECGRAAAHSR